jgi:DNA-binding transcriptional MerR regulator
MGAMLTIGEVARLARVTPDTIRYYERLGVVPRPARTPAGYRQYGNGVVDRLTVIRNAQRFGFSLKELAGFLRVREAGGKPCYQVRDAARRILDAADQQIAALVLARRDMRRTLKAWDRTLAVTPESQPARLLEQLPGRTASRPPARAMPRRRQANSKG